MNLLQRMSLALATGAKRVYCFFVGHLKGEYRGVEIFHIDKETHKIEYGNRVCCPRCAKLLKIEYW